MADNVVSLFEKSGPRITISVGWLEDADIDDSGFLVTIPYSGPETGIDEDVIWHGASYDEAVRVAVAYMTEHPGSYINDECDQTDLRRR